MSWAPEILHVKRDGREVDVEAVRAFVRAVGAGTVTDAQLGAFAMAVCLNGMSMAEQVTLTLAMRDSGTVLDWPELGGPVLDKHSTGGVGDLVSLVLGPMLAACGAYVPMISGRGLGHTGGTLDKLESIPGFNVRPGLARFREVVQAAGVSIIGQSAEVAPADGRLYATRDITSTVASVPLIVSSILSKKLAEGLDGLVLDVKTGSGAFMRELPQARELAAQLVQVACDAGLPTSALITDMNQPLAWSAGNALEVREAIDFLAGNGRHPRLESVTMALGQAALRTGQLADGEAGAERLLRRALDTGAAAERLARMVSMQGGPGDLVEAPLKYLAPAPSRSTLRAARDGYVQRMDTRAIGLVVMRLGGGRRRVEDKIDPRVGLSGLCRVGDRVERGTALVEIHAASEAASQRAEAALRDAIGIGSEPVKEPASIYGQIDGLQQER